jgi:transposase
MPKIIRITLSAQDRAILAHHLSQPRLSARLRERFEMVRLSDLGWSAPRIAAHLQSHEQTVRKHIRAFLTDGFNALPDRARSGRPPTITPTLLSVIDGKVSEWNAAGCRWTLFDVVTWLENVHGVRISRGRLSTLLQHPEIAPARHRRPALARPIVHPRRSEPRQQSA